MRHPTLGVISLTCGCLVAMWAPLAAQQQTGEAIYSANCATCHDTAATRAPSKDALRRIAVDTILRELTSGSMAPMARNLSSVDRETVAKYLGVAGNPLGTAESYCQDRTVTIPAGALAANRWNGWSPEPTNARYQASPGLTIDQVGKLQLKWAFGFAGDTIVYSIPTVAGNALFVGSNSGRVHALDARTGCTKWSYQAETGVRSAVVIEPIADSKHAALFGDRAGWFYSLEAETGRVLWKVKVDEHEGARMTGSPLIYQGVVYVPVSSVEETLARREGYECCSFRGSVVALRIANGSQVWKTYMIDDEPHYLTMSDRTRTEGPEGLEGARGPSGAAIWSAPTLDAKRKRVYVTTGDNYSDPGTDMSDAIVALDLETGNVVWHQQTTPGDVFNGKCQPVGQCPGPDYDYGSSVILEKIDATHDILLAGQKSGVVYALDPDNGGKILWQARVGNGGVNGGVQWGMASDGQNLYAANSDVGRRAGLPYDPTQGGGLTALRIRDGSKQWFVAPTPCDDKTGCSPALSAAVTVIPGVLFVGSLDGHMRAHATEDGRLLWDFDTAKAFDTVNGVTAKGGGVDGPGPIVVNGMMYVGSGYERTGGMGGNVLLAFGLE